MQLQEGATMSDQKTSPGPWKWDEENRLLDANGAFVIGQEPGRMGDTDDIVVARPADARLIAAAPQLLALARTAARYLGAFRRIEAESAFHDDVRALLKTIDGE